MLKALPDTPERTQQELTLQVTLGRALMATKGYGAPEVAQGTTTHGLALVQQGRGEEGIAEIRQGMAAYQATGAELGRPNFLARLAEAYGKVGQAEGGLTVLTEALAVVHRNGERTYEAELYRLKGELTLAQSSVQGLASSVQKEAEACFLKAIEIAPVGNKRSYRSCGR